MSKNKPTAPYRNLQEIEYRKQQLRNQINRQEKILMKDMDAYEDDIETFKRLWDKVKGVRHLRDNFSVSGLAKAAQTVKSLPIGKSTKRRGRKSGWFAAFTLGAEVVSWIVERRKRRKK